jgi:DNA invertase Pin-like site-specific DNA recombinase
MGMWIVFSRVSSDHQDYERQIEELKNYSEGKYIIDFEKEVFA